MLRKLGKKIYLENGLIQHLEDGSRILKMDPFDTELWNDFVEVTEERHQVVDLESLYRFLTRAASKLDLLDENFRFLNLVDDFWEAVIEDDPAKYARFKESLSNIDITGKLLACSSRIPEDILGIGQGSDKITEIINDTGFQLQIGLMLNPQQMQRIMGLSSLPRPSVTASTLGLKYFATKLLSKQTTSFLWFSTGFLTGTLFTYLLVRK